MLEAIEISIQQKQFFCHATFLFDTQRSTVIGQITND